MCACEEYATWPTSKGRCVAGTQKSVHSRNWSFFLSSGFRTVGKQPWVWVEKKDKNTSVHVGPTNMVTRHSVGSTNVAGGTFHCHHNWPIISKSVWCMWLLKKKKIKKEKLWTIRRWEQANDLMLPKAVWWKNGTWYSVSVGFVLSWEHQSVRVEGIYLSKNKCGGRNT